MWMSDKKNILASCSGWWIDKAYQMCSIFGDNKRTLKQLRLQGLSNGFQWLPSLFRMVTPMTMLSRWLLETLIQFHLKCSHPWLCKNCLAPPDARRCHSDIFHPKICKRHTSQHTKGQAQTGNRKQTFNKQISLSQRDLCMNVCSPEKFEN